MPTDWIHNDTHGRLFSYIGDTRCYCSSLSSPSDTTRSLSIEGHSYSDNNTRSLSSEGHSLDLCAQMSPLACPVRRQQLRALNFSPQKVGVAAGQPATCVTTKGASGRRPRHPPRCHYGRNAASDPSPRLRSLLTFKSCKN
jgi:hypothetical protein